MKTTPLIRIENLRLLADEVGGVPELSKLMGYKQPSYLYQILNRTIVQNGKPKNIGNNMAEKLEKVTGKPKGWLDMPHTPVIQAQNFGNGTQNNLINSSQTNISGSLPETPPTRIQDDDSMTPLIPQGSPLWADTADTALQNGKTYLIEYDGLQAVRRLFAVAGGQIRIKAHHPDYPEETLPAGQIRIIGRIVRWCVHD